MFLSFETEWVSILGSEKSRYKKQEFLRCKINDLAFIIFCGKRT